MSDWFEDGGAGSQVDVAKVLDSGAPDVMWRIVEAGALLSMGVTSDGGALGVTVTLDGRWRREYFRDSDELTSWLLGALAAVESQPPDRSASSAPRKRSRGARRP